MESVHLNVSLFWFDLVNFPISAEMCQNEHIIPDSIFTMSSDVGVIFIMPLHDTSELNVK